MSILDKNIKVDDYESLCKLLVQDLDLWMEYDGQPSKLPDEYKNTLDLIYRVRRFIKYSDNKKKQEQGKDSAFYEYGGG